MRRMPRVSANAPPCKRPTGTCRSLRQGTCLLLMFCAALMDEKNFLLRLPAPARGYSADVAARAGRKHSYAGLEERRAGRQASRIPLHAYPQPGEVPVKGYRALTKIKVRSLPSLDSPTLASTEAPKVQNGERLVQIQEGQYFEVSEELVYNYGEQTFMKLARQDGWVIKKGVAGQWAGQFIVEDVEQPRPGRTMNPFTGLLKEFAPDYWKPDEYFGRDATGDRPKR
eukprot:TRINITY_DN37829_c0_g1_i1.p1 TRINITY_DN37829_c0_g1~~TRINITY_DN37829_c0_g1_i1.p1  ORF type:complete len:227 (+),score=32.37 TRINITY_DN37829_c0_g1_i1:51-731(+)